MICEEYNNLMNLMSFCKDSELFSIGCSCEEREKI